MSKPFRHVVRSRVDIWPQHNLLKVRKLLSRIQSFRDFAHAVAIRGGHWMLDDEKIGLAPIDWPPDTKVAAHDLVRDRQIIVPQNINGRTPEIVDTRRIFAHRDDTIA